MRNLPTIGRRGRPLTGTRRHEWLALWLQDRRRGRGVAGVAPSGLFAGLAGYWDGDSPSDAFFGAADFSDNGAVTYDAASGPGSGPSCYIVGYAGVFSQGILENYDPVFQSIPATPTTWNLWLKQNDAGGKYVFGLFEPNSRGYLPFVALDIDIVGLVAIDQYGTSVGSSWTGYPPIDAGEWYMLTMVVTSTSMRCYVNGSLIVDFAYDGYTALPAQPFRINGFYWNFQGYWANFGFWTRALGDAEVEQLYNYGTGLTSGELY